MTKKFKDLTAEQLERYHATLAKFDIDKDSVVKQCQTSDHAGGMTVGHQHNCTKHLDVTCIEDLNKKVGLDCNLYQNGTLDDSGVHYPAALTTKLAKGAAPAELKKQLSSDDHKQVKQAMVSYLQGDSAKVASYKDAINASYFAKPVTLAVHSAEDITITAANPLIIKGTDGQPVSLVYGTVTVEPGGYIQSDVPLTIDSQVFTIQQ